MLLAKAPSPPNSYKPTLGLLAQLRSNSSPDPAVTLFPPETPSALYNLGSYKATKLELSSA